MADPGPIASCLALPATLTPNGALARAEDVDAIGQCLLEILRTPIGSRPLLPLFGSRLRMRRYDPNDVLLQQQVRDDVVEAIAQWEPRVKVTKVVFDQQGTTLKLTVWYAVIALGPNAPPAKVDDVLQLG